MVRNANGRLLVVGKAGRGDSNVVTVPILGEADCGEATRYASDEISGYLSVSPSVLRRSDMQGLFVLKAKGNSMNNARINNSKPIDDGDYVLIKKCDKADVRDGDYVVSVIQGLANIKRYKVDERHRRIVLLPESHYSHLPIIIASEDLDAYVISGKVVDVIKGIDDLAHETL